MFDISEHKQGTEEWLKDRAGKFTGSDISTIFSGESTIKFQKMLYDKASERISGLPTKSEFEPTTAMKRGTELEDVARVYYSRKTNIDVTEVNFCTSKEYPFIGCSPDGITKNGGLVEIKCPLLHNHLQFFVGNKKVDNNYILQMQMQCLVTSADYCDFVSFNPESPKESLILFVKRFTFKKPELLKLLNKIIEVNEKIEELKFNLKNYK